MKEKNLPTERLHIDDDSDYDAQFRAFAEKLVTEGKRPWFEVWYPRPEHFDGTDEEWNAAQADTFDAVEYVDGEFVSLPPYDQIGDAS